MTNRNIKSLKEEANNKFIGKRDMTRGKEMAREKEKEVTRGKEEMLEQLRSGLPKAVDCSCLHEEWAFDLVNSYLFTYLFLLCFFIILNLFNLKYILIIFFPYHKLIQIPFVLPTYSTLSLHQ